jgi:low temperature requirement protein LtrA
MVSHKEHKRLWWQPPRATRDRDPHRTVSYLELFYDLFYVVLISEVAHGLAAGATGIVGYVFLFTVVWFAWLNGSLYHELHGNNDIRTRVFTFLQMFAVAAITLFVHDALGETGAGFALSYACFLLILTYLWWRTGVHLPEHRLLTVPYVFAFLAATAMFAGSAFVETPLRFVIWGVAVFLILITPAGSNLVARKHPEVIEEMDRTTVATHSLIERFDLFTIIVLGEVIIGVVRGVAAHHDLTVGALLTGGLGMLVAIGLWWLYFDSVAGQRPRKGRTGMIVWTYLHLPLTMGIAATGACVLNVIGNDDEAIPAEVRWLMAGSIAAVILSTALLSLSSDLSASTNDTHKPARRAMYVLVLLIAGLGFVDLDAKSLLAIVAAGLLLPIYLAIRVWIRQQTVTIRQRTG